MPVFSRFNLVFVLMFAFALIGCSQSETARIMEACEEAFPTYAEEMSDIQAEWMDALDIATSTSRISLAGPISDLQSIQRRAEKVEAPECVLIEHDEYVEGMDTLVDFMLDFLADPDAEVDDEEIDEATDQIIALWLIVEQYEVNPETFFEVLTQNVAEETGEAAVESESSEE